MGFFKRKYGVFISYSHEDQKKVYPIFDLIRAMRSDLVFQDVRSIQPGELWETKINSSLNQAKIFIVFWCRHSETSKYVKKEIQRAIEKKKIIIPLKLDYVELPSELFQYQWIDFSHFDFHGDDLYDVEESGEKHPIVIMRTTMAKKIVDKVGEKINSFNRLNFLHW